MQLNRKGMQRDPGEREETQGLGDVALSSMGGKVNVGIMGYRYLGKEMGRPIWITDPGPTWENE